MQETTTTIPFCDAEKLVNVPGEGAEAMVYFKTTMSHMWFCTLIGYNPFHLWVWMGPISWYGGVRTSNNGDSGGWEDAEAGEMHSC